ncbi:MAG TPA: hypothetical protein VHE30_22385 [Polyangiaceae bacterium]|nr:hypothetical protein [Polyangiaceae bacterium]
MRWKALGVGCVLSGLVGCGATPSDAPDDPEAGNVAQSATAPTPCPAYTATLQDHVIAGRAVRFDSTFLFFNFTTYDTAGLNPEQIGSFPTQVVTLYPKPDGYTANAALCQKATCGNGVLEAPTEQCDGNQFSGGAGSTPSSSLNCNAFGADPPWAAGYDVGCTADCKYDFSTCKAVVCGDGIIDGNEQCDGTNLGSIRTCQQYAEGGVFTGGTLECAKNCTFDTSACTSLCGNGVIDPGEDCDGTRFSAQYAGKTCSDFTVPYRTWPFGLSTPYSPGPITCDKFCKVNLTSVCVPPPACYYVVVGGGQPSAGVRCF